MKNRLMQLLADNRQSKGRVARIEQKAREATLYLYDMLVSTDMDAEWWGGVSAQALVPQIDQLDVDVIHLRINSPGGDVFAGQAIAAALERHKAKVVAHIDGLAASAATAIAVAADEVLMASGAMFMIHNAWTIAIGDKNDFLECAALLEKVDGTLADATRRTQESLCRSSRRSWMPRPGSPPRRRSSSASRPRSRATRRATPRLRPPRRSGTCARSKRRPQPPRRRSFMTSPRQRISRAASDSLAQSAGWPLKNLRERVLQNRASVHQTPSPS
jgi:ATP-dependent protease ClpP protease subunit